VQQARIRATRTERIMIVELSDKKAIDFSQSADPMRYTNHSCKPNARLCIRQGRVEFYALRAIAQGEEITVDYGETHHEGKLRCRCGVAGCRARCSWFRFAPPPRSLSGDPALSASRTTQAPAAPWPRARAGGGAVR
jgi:hypothetical protein